MRKAILIGLIISLLVVLAGLSSSAEVLKISVGVSQSNMLWQTSPPAFAEVTRWGGVSLSLLFGSVTISGAVTIVDFKTMQIPKHPSFSIDGDVKLAQLGITSLYTGIGVVVDPYADWVGLDLGGSLATEPTPFMEISAYTGVETTRGAPGYPPGTGLYFGISVNASWPLF